MNDNVGSIVLEPYIAQVAQHAMPKGGLTRVSSEWDRRSCIGHLRHTAGLLSNTAVARQRFTIAQGTSLILNKLFLRSLPKETRQGNCSADLGIFDHFCDVCSHVRPSGFSSDALGAALGQRVARGRNRAQGQLFDMLFDAFCICLYSLSILSLCLFLCRNMPQHASSAARLAGSTSPVSCVFGTTAEVRPIRPGQGTGSILRDSTFAGTLGDDMKRSQCGSQCDLNWLRPKGTAVQSLAAECMQRSSCM